MKRSRKLAALLLAVLVLAGCGRVGPGETTAPTTEPTTKPPTAPTVPTSPPTVPTVPTTPPPTAPTVPTSAPTVPTAPPTTEPEPQVLDPALWWREAQHPSYEEAIAAVPTYTPSNTLCWLIDEGNAGILYTLNSYYTGAMYIDSSVHPDTYSIPGSKALKNAFPVAADMEYVYLVSDTAVAKMELLTGTIAASVPWEGVLDYAVMDHYMLYYAAYTGEAIHIYRIYLPEMKQDLLNTLEPPDSLYFVSPPDLLDEALCWDAITPELAALLDKEFQNSNSPYKYPLIYGEKADFSSEWERENFWDAGYRPDAFLYGVQEMSGIPALTKYTYCFESGSLTSVQGIIDGCSFGTAAPHDHYNPELTRLPDYVMVNGSWQPAPGQEIRGAVSGSAEENISFEPYGYGTEPQKLYLVRDGYYTLYADFTLKDQILREDARYAITYDNRLVQISHDGSLCNTLYTGKDTLRGFAVYENSIFFGEGERLIELDLSSNQYRVILEQEYLRYVSLMESQDKTVICVAAYAGLAIREIDYDPVTGTAE